MYQRLDSDQQKKIKRAINLMSDNIYHPSLRVKRIQGTKGIWEASATTGLRITFDWEGDTITLRNCGQHDETLKNP
jgi:mRNA-degrading endonuclease RelE of RelBE toxin-antitoxin system